MSQVGKVQPKGHGPPAVPQTLHHRKSTPKKEALPRGSNEGSPPHINFLCPKKMPPPQNLHNYLFTCTFEGRVGMVDNRVGRLLDSTIVHWALQLSIHLYGVLTHKLNELGISCQFNVFYTFWTNQRSNEFALAFLPFCFVTQYVSKGQSTFHTSYKPPILTHKVTQHAVISTVLHRSKCWLAFLSVHTTVTCFTASA